MSHVAHGFICPSCLGLRSYILRYIYRDHYLTELRLLCLHCEHVWNEKVRPDN